jgi:hypothetical protein
MPIRSSKESMGVLTKNTESDAGFRSVEKVTITYFKK